MQYRPPGRTGLSVSTSAGKLRHYGCGTTAVDAARAGGGECTHLYCSGDTLPGEPWNSRT